MDSYPSQEYTGEVTPHQATMLFGVGTSFLRREGVPVEFTGGETGTRYYFDPEEHSFEFRLGTRDILVTAFDDPSQPPHTDNFSHLAVRMSHYFPDYAPDGTMRGWADIRKVLFVSGYEFTERLIYEKINEKMGVQPSAEDDLAVSEKIARLAQGLEQYAPHEATRLIAVRAPLERADMATLISLISSQPL